MNEMYWITRLCVLNDALGCLIAFTSIALVIAFIVYLINKGDFEEVAQSARLWIKRLFVAMIIFFTVFVFVPSKKDMVLIVAGGAVIDYIQDSDEVKKLPDNVVKAINDWLTEDEK